jgi:phage head maturation protease
MSSTPASESRYLSQFLKHRPELTRRGEHTIGGTVVLFGKRSQPIAGFTEIFDESFASKWIGDGCPGAVIRFNSYELLGTAASGTLRFSRTELGVDFGVDVPRHLPVVVEYVDRNEILDVAIEMQIFEDRWEHHKGYPVRHLVSGRLAEISPLTVDTPTVVNVDAALQSLARHAGESLETVVTLSERGALWELWGWSPPERERREPIRLGIDGREAHVEVIEAQQPWAPILENYRVSVTPKDLVKER